MRQTLTSALIVSAFILCLQSCGEKSVSSPSDPAPTELRGRWYFTGINYPDNNRLSFSRINNYPPYGQSIVINPDGSYADAYVAPCGNDGNIHHTKGKWSYRDDTKTFEATIPICLMDKKYKVFTVTNDTLVFAKP